MSAMERYLAQAQQAEGNLSRVAQAQFEGAQEKFDGQQALLGDEINMGNEDLTRDIVKEGVFAGALGTAKVVGKVGQKIASSAGRITTTVRKNVNNLADVVQNMGGDASGLRNFGSSLENAGNAFDAAANGRLADLGTAVDNVRLNAYNALNPENVAAARGNVEQAINDNITTATSVDRDLVRLPERPAETVGEAPAEGAARAATPIENLRPQEIDPATSQPIQERADPLRDLETGQADPSVADLPEMTQQVADENLFRFGEDPIIDRDAARRAAAARAEAAAPTQIAERAPTTSQLGRGFDIAERTGGGTLQQAQATAIQERLAQPPAISQADREATETATDFFTGDIEGRDLSERVRGTADTMPQEIAEANEQNLSSVQSFLGGIERRGEGARAQISFRDTFDEPPEDLQFPEVSDFMGEIGTRSQNIFDAQRNLSDLGGEGQTYITRPAAGAEAEADPIAATGEQEAARGAASVANEPTQDLSNLATRQAEETGGELDPLAGLTDKTGDIAKLFGGSTFDEFSGESIAAGIGTIGEFASGVGDLALLGEGVKFLVDSQKEGAEQMEKYNEAKKQLSLMGSGQQAPTGSIASGVFDSSAEPIADATFSHF